MSQTTRTIVRLVVIALLAAGLCPRSAHAQSTVTKAIVVEPATVAEAFTHRRYALTIGIDDYADPAIPDLTTCENDARAIHALWTDPQRGRVPPENAALLVGPDATARRIRKALHQLSRVPADSTVFVYFSGHGTRSGRHAFWVTHDSELHDLPATALPDRDIHAFLDAIAARRVVVMLDCCDAAATVAGHKAVNPNTTTELSDILKPFIGRGRAYLMAAGDGQQALTAGDLKRSVFTHGLIEGLTGQADIDQNGVVVLTEIMRYLDTHVTDQARQRGGTPRPVTRMDDVEQPSQFALTIDPPRLYANQKKAAQAKALTGKRLQTLWELYLNGKMARDQYQLAQTLLAATRSSLDLYDSRRHDQLIAVADGRLDASKLARALAAIESPDQREARLAREAAQAAQRLTPTLPTPVPPQRATDQQQVARRVDQLYRRAKAHHNPRQGQTALRALDELLKLMPGHSQAQQLHREITGNRVSHDPQWWLQRAESCAARIESVDARAAALCRVVSAWATLGRADHALTLAETIPGVGNRAWAYGEVAAAQAKAGDLEAAQQTTALILVPHWRSFALRHLAEALARAGHWDQADHVIPSITDPTDRALAYSGLAIARYRAGQTRASQRVLHHARNSLRRIPVDRQQAGVSAFSRTAADHTRAGDPAGAEETFHLALAYATRLRDPSARVQAYTQIAWDQHQAHDTQKATHALRLASTLAAQIDDHQHRTMAYCQLTAAYVKLKNPRRARHAIGQAEDGLAKIQAEYLRPRALAWVCQAWVELGDPGRAQALAETIEDDAWRLATRHPLAATMAKRGALQPLWQQIQSMNRPDHQVNAYLGATHGLIAAAKPTRQRHTD